MKKKFIKKFGLKKLPKDERDFKLSKILKLPPLEELPKEFELEPVSIKDQKDTDYCTAMATCGASELQEGVELSPEWSFAVSKMISGDPEEYGQDLRTAMKVHTKYGAVEEKELTDEIKATIVGGSMPVENNFRYINNYPKDFFDKAKKHQKQSFFKIDGQYDSFDDIRAFIWAFRAKKQAVVFGVEWNWPLDMKIIEPSFTSGGGHAIYCLGFGWKQINGKTYLTIMNSYGREAGDNGRHYFPREIINQFVKEYGAFTFTDMPSKEAKKVCWSASRRAWEIIKKSIKDYFNIMFN